LDPGKQALSASLGNEPGSTLRRLPAVDGLRGLLALVVLAFHFTRRLDLVVLAQPANVAVCGFFVLSGYVLTRSWEGRFGLFLARRFLRLWPVYALCLAVGYGVAGVSPVGSQFFWYPILTANAKPEIDPPIWSLCIEAWAMPFMPLFVWVASGKMLRIAFGFAIVALAGVLYIKFAFGLFFILGAALARWEFRDRLLESPAPQWIGRISYSLYLSHWLVFAVAERAFGTWGLIASFPVAFLVGWAVWRFVEQPSIALSRRVARLGLVGARAGQVAGEAA
jgi:peptidoglycan/LPS O-acetylase OafA/YrhL